MAEWTNGLHRLVTIPAVYSWVQKTLGGPDAKGRIASRLFSGLAGKHVVEIGCGPGLWSDYLSHAASFTGIDRNPKHIEVATSSYGSDRVRFLCGDLAHADVISTVDNCDAVIAIGILHHLDDDIARDVLAQAAAVLRPHGVFIGLEPVYHGRQHPVARLLKLLDSGRNIRTEASYRALFNDDMRVETSIATDLMRVPYSHCLIRGTRT